MRFYQGTHKFYAGVDLHTKTMYVCVLDQDGQMENVGECSHEPSYVIWSALMFARWVSQG